jgi:hypothetical protein
VAIYRGIGGAGEANDDATLNAVTKQAQDAAESATEAASSATAAASSATAAASSASSASTSATNASTSATNAATSASAASTSATNAATSATAAASSATAAAASESTAAASATAAEDAQTAAEAAQTAAETANTSTQNLFDTFGDQYLGSHANDSAVATYATAQGYTLDSGDIYWNTTDSVLKFYDGSAWVSPETLASNSATAAATSATNAATSATNAANSATSAATSATTATTQASAASTSATNAATSATNAATSETNAATSATAADTSATDAANSATAAAVSATTATTQASAASTSATNAATSETNAATSATSASTSATAAATSATSASTAATNAAASYDAFDDRYLGDKSSAPSVDNDGDALVTGALYYDTTAGSMYVYNGSAWEAAYSGASDFVAVTGDTMTGDLSFGDNDKAIFGAGSDLQIYHNGSGSYIDDAGTGPLVMRIGSNGTFLLEDLDGDDLIRAVSNSFVRLSYNGSGRLVTTDTGIDVTGTVIADGLTVDGATTIADGLGGVVNILDTRSGLSGSGQKIAFFSNNRTDANEEMAYIQPYFTSDNGGSGNVQKGQIRLGTSGAERIRIDQHGDISFFEDTGTTAKFFWDASAERLGIGTDSPNSPLEIQNSAAGIADALELTNFTGDSSYIKAKRALTLSADYNNNSGANQSFISFDTDATERMRINSNGAIGLSGANYGTSGQVLTSNGSGSAPSWADAGGGGGGLKLIKETYYLAGATWTKQANTEYVFVDVIGGGGGAGKISSTYAYSGAGGGGAGRAQSWMTIAQSGNTQTVTIGSAGNNNATASTSSVAGTAGGASSFGNLVSANGGGGGGNGTNNATGGTGGSGTVNTGIGSTMNGGNGHNISSGAQMPPNSQGNGAPPGGYYVNTGNAPYSSYSKTVNIGGNSTGNDAKTPGEGAMGIQYYLYGTGAKWHGSGGGGRVIVREYEAV